MQARFLLTATPVVRAPSAQAILFAAGLCACGDPAGHDPAPPSAEVSVELGVPAGDDGLGFAPLDEGDVLKLQTFGQGGTHVLVAVRANGFGNRAFVSASLTNLQSGTVVTEPPPARPQLLYCGSEDSCDLVPYLVHASGIAEPDEERHGLEVELEAEVRSEAGLLARKACDVVLSTEDL